MSKFAIRVGPQLDAALEVCYAARRPPLLRGGTGIGKSATLEEFAHRKGIEFIARDLSLMEPPDLVGLPMMDGGVTRYLPPSFLPTSGKGILVFEELNRAPAYMRAPCLQLLTARRLNDYRLPDGWLPAAAINPSDDGYEVMDLDWALTSRFVLLDVMAETADWLLWARANGVHEAVIAYVGSDPTVFEHPCSNPRSWTYVSDLLKADSSASIALIAGCVGAERASAFLSYSRKTNSRAMTANDVLTNYKSLRPKLRNWIKNGNIDFVKATLFNVQTRIQSSQLIEQVRHDKTAWPNLRRFFADLPGDLRHEAEAFFVENEIDMPRLPKRKS